jgi:threonine dehydrogenase-like Zn-dependent dehydrogenase
VGGGPTSCFDVSPAPATVALSLALVRHGGTVLLAGLKEGRPVEIVSDQIVNRSHPRARRHRVHRFVTCRRGCRA